MGKPYYEEGLHIGEIKQHGIGRTKTDKPQIVWRVKVLGYPEGDTGLRPHRGQYERTIYQVISEKTVPFVSETLKSIGFDGEKVSQLNPDHPQHVDMRGTQVNLWCKHEEDLDGEVREKWQFSKGSQALELPQLGSKEIRELDSLFGRNRNAAKPATSAPAQNIHNQEIEDDDLPF